MSDSRSLEDLLDRQVDVTTDATFGWRGEGFVRVDDGWLSIPSALPGERVTVKVEAEVGRGRRAFGQIVDVVEPSPERTPSYCDRATICRGCQLRTASSTLEASFKQDRILELLQKFGEFDPESLPEPKRVGCDNLRDRGYRWRSSLTYRAEDRSLGLVSGATDALIGMADCPSLTPSARAIVARVEDALGSLDVSPEGPAGGANGLRAIHIEASDPPRVIVRPAAPFPGSASHFTGLTTALRDTLPEATVAVELDHGYDVVAGDRFAFVPYLAGGLTLAATLGAWTHATVGPPERLYELVLEWLGRAMPGRHLDVGCAIGAISLLAARLGGSALGIDRSLAATESATRNASRLGLDATFVTSDWEKGLRDAALQGLAFDSVSLNPMREPLGARVFDYIRELGPSRLLYLGPSPEASARDFGELQSRGWRLSDLFAVDLHPASYQVMVGAAWHL